MNGFWWFRENEIAGMARPGFNSVRWYDLPFDQALVTGWIGQYSSGRLPRRSLWNHLEHYAPRIYKFHGLDNQTGQKFVDLLRTEAGLRCAVEGLKKKTGLISDFSIHDEEIEIKFDDSVLLREIAFLKQKGINSIVTLTELHHNQKYLELDFEAHHFSIRDLEPPTLEQAKDLAKILSDNSRRKRKIAVHCLAGIGRTSTMILAAQLLLGEDYSQLKKQIAEKNPHFVLTGQQAAFLDEVAVNCPLTSPTLQGYANESK